MSKNAPKGLRMTPCPSSERQCKGTTKIPYTQIILTTLTYFMPLFKVLNRNTWNTNYSITDFNNLHHSGE